MTTRVVCISSDTFRYNIAVQLGVPRLRNGYFVIRGGFRDSFDMGIPPPVPAFAPQSPTSSVSLYGPDRPSVKEQGILSVSELEAMSNKLKDLHCFELAFMAARQRLGLLRLDEIAKEKSSAVGNDDLEKAVLCKREEFGNSGETVYGRHRETLDTCNGNLSQRGFSRGAH